MKLILFILIAISTISLASEKPFDEKAFLESLKSRYGLGLIYQDYQNEKNIYKYKDISGGLVVIKMSKEADIYKAGIKTGWVLLSVDGASLTKDGGDIFFNRLQNKELSDDLRFEVYDGNAVREVVLTRTKKNYPLLTYVEVK